MKKITAFVGSARKGHTYNAVAQFLSHVQSLGDFEVEIVRMSDYRIEVCKGCQVCFSKGEEYCPLKDDRDILIEKMMASDGVVFASPNYSFQVSALLKTFLDRLVPNRPNSCSTGKKTGCKKPFWFRLVRVRIYLSPPALFRQDFYQHRRPGHVWWRQNR